MKSFKASFAVICVLLAGNCWGYGGSGGGATSCKKPQFRAFDPPQHSEVSPASPFSFQVTGADPDMIQVTVKQQPVDVNVTSKNKVFQVTGSLPENLRDTYARIQISASGPNRCKGTAGWLVKISK